MGVRSVQPSERVVNLGCGNWIIDGAVNVDRTRHRPEVDVVWDLETLPWPFEDEAFNLVIARAVLEHLRLTLVESMDEMWRILRPGGKAVVKLPWWRSDNSWTADHWWKYNLRVFNIFDPTKREGRQYGFYTPRKWRIVKGPRLNKERTSFHTTLVKIDRRPGAAAEGTTESEGPSAHGN